MKTWMKWVLVCSTVVSVTFLMMWGVVTEQRAKVAIASAKQGEALAASNLELEQNLMLLNKDLLLTAFKDMNSGDVKCLRLTRLVGTDKPGTMELIPCPAR